MKPRLVFLPFASVIFSLSILSINGITCIGDYCGADLNRKIIQGAVAFVALKSCASCIKIITSGDEALIERLGKYNRRLGPGLHFIFRPFETVSYEATIREQVLDVPPQQCYTLDNAPIKADAVVFLKVTDIVAARYNVQDVQNAILNLCLTQLREEVGKLTLDESFSSRERINKELLKDLNAVCVQWGVEITRVEIQNLEPSRDILAAMELQMAAERKKRASILKSEGERITSINEAEGEARAATTNAEAEQKVTVLRAKAEAERQRVEAGGLKVAIETVATAIAESSSSTKESAVEGAVQFLSLIRYLETQSKFSSSNNTKIIMLPSKDSLPLTYGGLKFLLD